LQLIDLTEQENPVNVESLKNEKYKIIDDVQSLQTIGLTEQ
jgi:hypothetical protein